MNKNCKNCDDAVFNSIIGEYKCRVKLRFCTRGEMDNGCAFWSEKKSKDIKESAEKEE